MSYKAVILTFPDLARTLGAVDIAHGTAIFELTDNTSEIGQTRIWTPVTIITDFGFVPAPDDYVIPASLEEVLDEALTRTLGLSMVMYAINDGTLAEAIQDFEETLLNAHEDLAALVDLVTDLLDG